MRTMWIWASPPGADAPARRDDLAGSPLVARPCQMSSARQRMERGQLGARRRSRRGAHEGQGPAAVRASGRAVLRESLLGQSLARKKPSPSARWRPPLGRIKRGRGRAAGHPPRVGFMLGLPRLSGAARVPARPGRCCPDCRGPGISRTRNVLARNVLARKPRVRQHICMEPPLPSAGEPATFPGLASPFPGIGEDAGPE